MDSKVVNIQKNIQFKIAMFQSETYFVFENKNCWKVEYSTEKALEVGEIKNVFLEFVVHEYNVKNPVDEIVISQDDIEKYFNRKQDTKTTINLEDIYIFKVKDYITILVGRFDSENDCYYVQRVDGKKYKYLSYRVEWSKKLKS